MTSLSWLRNEKLVGKTVRAVIRCSTYFKGLFHNRFMNLFFRLFFGFKTIYILNKLKQGFLSFLLNVTQTVRFLQYYDFFNLVFLFFFFCKDSLIRIEIRKKGKILLNAFYSEKLIFIKN